MSLKATLAGVLISLLSLTGAARADLIVSFTSTPVPAGGTGTVDVWVSHDPASATSSDSINNFSIEVQLANLGVDGTQLAFDPSQNFGAIVGTAGYIFGTDSAGASGAFPGAPFGLNYPYDTVTVSDSTASGNPVVLSGSSPYLLAALTVTTATGAPPIANVDSFSVSLIPSSGTGSISDLGGTTQTVFDNIDFNNTGMETSATPYSSPTPGTVTISESAVPEPASIVAGMSALLILGALRCARWHASRHRSNV